MVKGISKQVIVVNSPDKKLFDQAIFILSDEAINSGGISDSVLLKEARQLISSKSQAKRCATLKYAVFTSIGAFLVGFIWVLSAIL